MLDVPNDEYLKRENFVRNELLSKLDIKGNYSIRPGLGNMFDSNRGLIIEFEEEQVTPIAEGEVRSKQYAGWIGVTNFFGFISLENHRFVEEDYKYFMNFKGRNNPQFWHQDYQYETASVLHRLGNQPKRPHPTCFSTVEEVVRTIFSDKEKLFDLFAKDSTPVGSHIKEAYDVLGKELLGSYQYDRVTINQIFMFTEWMIRNQGFEKEIAEYLREINSRNNLIYRHNWESDKSQTLFFYDDSNFHRENRYLELYSGKSDLLHCRELNHNADYYPELKMIRNSKNRQEE